MGSLTGVLILAPGTAQQLDLTPYLAVDDDSLDPSDPQFTQKIWSHSLLKEGGVQALEHLDLKGTVWPLRLKAGSRDALNALVQQINNLIEQPGMTASWQDVGSSQPTYFDVSSGILTPKYDFRKAGQFWLNAELQLFFMPLGHTATMRLVASAAGTGPLLKMSIPSPILGDAGALIQAQIVGGMNQPNQMALAVIPNGYTPEFQVSAATNVPSPIVGATIIGASGAVGSQFIRQHLPPGALSSARTIGAWVLPNATPYFGTNRLLAIARSGANPTFVGTIIGLQAQFGYPAASAMATAWLIPAAGGGGPATSSWQLVDLGTFTVPSAIPSISPLITLTGLYAASQTATGMIDVTDLIVLPEANSAWLDDSAANLPALNGAVPPYNQYVFDGVANETYHATASQLPSRLTGLQRGAVPKLNPGASQSIVALILTNSINYGSGAGVATAVWANASVNAFVLARERVRFAF
jgi:hypothetical protein